MDGAKHPPLIDHLPESVVPDASSVTLAVSPSIVDFVVIDVDREPASACRPLGCDESAR